jgi:energy-coupling factor transporter ATP-binding protein EcfA2
MNSRESQDKHGTFPRVALSQEAPTLTVYDDEPLMEPLEYAVTDDELASKRGNFVFTVGNVASGKSTLQSLLVARLWSREDINFLYNCQKGDHRHDHLLNEWVDNIRHGILPPRTKQGRLQEFNISFGQLKKKPLDVSFLEISGEDIKSIVPALDPDDRPRLNSQLVEYLRAKKSRINKRFIFVSDCQANKERTEHSGRRTTSEDILFNSLLRYLLGKDGLAMERLNLLFVAAKWDTVEKEYRSVSQYFARHFPQTRAVLQSERCTAVYVPFSVGTLADVEVVDDDSQGRHFEKRIVSLEAFYIDVVIQWLYHSFTGNQLRNMPSIRKSWIDKIKRLFQA